ncbi:hypothetical protein ACLK1T_17670 [Escherichia coli]
MNVVISHSHHAAANKWRSFMVKCQCAVKNKPCATAFHCPHCQQTIRIRDDISAALLADAQRALP